jgi:hypothetical protein
MWVVTDSDNEKWLFENKPIRSGMVWTNTGGGALPLNDFPFKDHLPSFIQQQQWKDAPLQIKLSMVKK